MPPELLATPVILAGCSRVAVYFLGPADEHGFGQRVRAGPG